MRLYHCLIIILLTGHTQPCVGTCVWISMSFYTYILPYSNNWINLKLKPKLVKRIVSSSQLTNPLYFNFILSSLITLLYKSSVNIIASASFSSGTEQNNHIVLWTCGDLLRANSAQVNSFHWMIHYSVIITKHTALINTKVHSCCKTASLTRVSNPPF